MAGEECCNPAPPTEHPSIISGRVEQWDHLLTYVSGSPSANAAIILISDVMGFESPLLRKLADKVATAGYFVVVPDYFYGDPFKPGNSVLQEWIKSHQPEKGFQDSLVILENLKKRGFSVIGAGGFCWGAKVAVELAKTEDLKGIVLLHPSLVTVEDIKDVKIPIAILAAEHDKITPPALVEQFKTVLSERPEIDSFVTIYPGVPHGWAVRYDEKDANAVENAENAQSKMLEWFNKYLKLA